MAALPAVNMPLTSSAAPFRPVSSAPLTVSAKVPHCWLVAACSPSAGGSNSAPKKSTTAFSTPVMPVPTRSAKLFHSVLMLVWSPSAGGLNSPPRKDTMPSNTPLMPPLTSSAKLFQASMTFCCVSSGTPSRSMIVFPMLPMPERIASSTSPPSLIQSLFFRPSQMAVTICGSFSTSRGMPWIRPSASFTIIWMAAGSSSGSASMMPSTTPSSSLPAASISSGRLSIKKPATLVTSSVASSVSGPMLSVIPVSTLCSSSTAAGSSTRVSPGSASAMWFTIRVTSLVTMGSLSSTMSSTSSKASMAVLINSSSSSSSSSGLTPSCSAAATLPMLLLAASTRGWKAGIITRPMLFFRAVPVALNFCMESSNAPIFARFSLLKTVPMAWASLPMSRQARLPASISGFSSLALLPNSSMAIASRSTGFSILPRASMASMNTSSLSRRSPLKSRQETPSFTKVSWALSLPSWASLIFLVSFVRLPVMVSTLVSMKLLA